MPDLRKILAAGAAVAAIVLPAAAHAHDGKRADSNLMTVVRADGSVAETRNTTPVAPRVVQVQRVSPFAMMDQMAAQMSAMMAQTRAMQMRAAQGSHSGAQSGAQTVSAGAAPAGVCMQSVEVIQRAGQEPQVTRRSSGNCAAPNASTQAAPTQRAPAHRPAPIAPTTRSVPADSI